MGTEAARPSDWIPAVPLSWSVMLFRPVTLRRHLSVVLPFSESDGAKGSLCLGLSADQIRLSIFDSLMNSRCYVAGRKSIG